MSHLNTTTADVPTPAMPARLLLADDDPAFLESTAALLRARGFNCETSTNSTEARDLLARSEYDLILVDVNMPGNADLSLVRELSEQPGLPPIVIVTGLPTLQTAALAVQLRAAAYLIKPVNVEELIRLLEREINAHRVYRLLCRSKSEVETHLGRVRQLEAMMRATQRRATDEGLATYVALAFEHFVTTITDLCELVNVLSAREGTEATRQRLAGSHPFLLIEALRETIQVLEQTRHSFKSKELAELRQKLEALLDGPKSPAPRPER